MNLRIKAIRKEIKKNGKPISQEEFGYRLGVSRDVIANLERTTNPVAPTEQMLKLICREFNVNETWLRTGEGEMFNALSMDEQLAFYLGTILSEQGDTFKKRLIAALSALDESEWSAVEAFARKLVEQSRDAPPNKEGG